MGACASGYGRLFSGLHLLVTGGVGRGSSRSFRFGLSGVRGLRTSRVSALRTSRVSALRTSRNGRLLVDAHLGRADDFAVRAGSGGGGGVVLVRTDAPGDSDEDEEEGEGYPTNPSPSFDRARERAGAAKAPAPARVLARQGGGSACEGDVREPLSANRCR
jgi:hypothetical protein